MGIVLAVVALAAICSTPETRAAGAQAVKPFARGALIVSLIIWAAVLFIPSP